MGVRYYKEWVRGINYSVSHLVCEDENFRLRAMVLIVVSAVSDSSRLSSLLEAESVDLLSVGVKPGLRTLFLMRGSILEVTLVLLPSFGVCALLFKEELLHANDRTGTLNTSETNDLASVNIVVLHQVASVQSASTSKTLFAMNSHDTCYVLLATTNLIK